MAIKHTLLVPSDMSRDMREPVFGVSDQVRHKLACTATEKDEKFEILDLRRREIVLSVLRKERR